MAYYDPMAPAFSQAPSTMPTYDAPPGSVPWDPTAGPTALSRLWDFIKRGGSYGDYQNGQPPAATQQAPQAVQQPALYPDAPDVPATPGGNPAAPSPALAQAIKPVPTAAPSVSSPDAMDGVQNNHRNNPLNIRFAGQSGATDAGGFAAFPDQQAGVAAAQNQFGLYAQRGVKTLRDLISTWAPPNENPTDKYIQFVSDTTGISPDQPIDLTNPDVQKRLIPAMSVFENGHQGTPSASPGPSIQPSQDVGSGIVGNSAVSSEQPDTSQTAPADPMANIQEVLQSLRPSTSQQLAALASGLLSGPTLGQGFGKGLQNLEATNAGYRDLAVKVAQARAMANYRNQMIGLGQGRLVVQQQNAGTSQGRLQETNRHNTAAEGVQQQNADTSAGRLAAETGGALTPEAKAAAKANVQDIQKFSDQEASARDNLRTASDLLAVINKEGMTGPDVASKVQRYFANAFGVQIGSVTPTGVQLAEKDLAALRNGQLLSQTRGSVPRSNAELQALQAGMGSMDRNPDALKIILQRDIEANQRFIRAGDAWRSMTPDQQKAALAQNNGLFSAWRNGFAASDPADRPVSGTPGQLPAPRVTPTGGSWSTTASGVRWSVH